MVRKNQRPGWQFEYNQELARQTMLYEQWIIRNEEPFSHVQNKGAVVPTIFFYQELEDVSYVLSKLEKEQAESREQSQACSDYILCLNALGTMSYQALKIIQENWTKDTSILYADEDTRDQLGNRENPWFKPDWSPDTFLDHNYFGGMFVMKRTLFHEVCKNATCTDSSSLLREAVILLMKSGKMDSRKSNVVHVSSILYHNVIGNLIKEEVNKKDISKEADYPKEKSDDPLVTIVIPSKDNPEMLGKLFTSLYQKTEYKHFEICLVDNGSSEENQAIINDLKVKYNFNYLFGSYPFNFSKMCNLGASQAKGEYLLFLNDDIEIIEPNWLTKLLEKGCLPHVGAVGAKLLYPDGETIQHIGVTNLEIGPAHKLGGFKDDHSYYFGVNKGVHNVLAVTAACLLVQKDKFDAVKGFDENLEVAYNDVEICFALFEAGYYNVVRNDVTLLHYESFSRGDDKQATQKYVRLLEEKDKLYKKHPLFYHNDPFYSRHLVIDSPDYFCKTEFAYESRKNYLSPNSLQEAVGKKVGKPLLHYRKKWCYYNIDFAGLEIPLELSEEKHYRIEGWSILGKSDNRIWKTSILLKDEHGNVYTFPCITRYRKELAEVFPKEKNCLLAGFVLRFAMDAIPEGRYEIIIVKESKRSRLTFGIETKSNITIKQ